LIHEPYKKVAFYTNRGINMQYENEYNEWLDEQGPVIIGTLEYNPSWVLMRCDPVAYRVGYDDFCDMMGWYEEEE
jgi:hypothetical protein